MSKSGKSRPVTQEKVPLLPQLIATSFGVGFLPVAPGTWGALLALLLWLPLYLFASIWVAFWLTLAATILYCIAGTWASTLSEKYWGKDPVVACADETVGQWIALLPVVPLSAGVNATPWWCVVLSFVLFRAFDIWKPLGIRKLERLPGGVGMMADDIAAGILAGFVIFLINILY